MTFPAATAVADDGVSGFGTDEYNNLIGYLTPTGAEMQWPVATPPPGWLIEDGSSHLITEAPDLSALIRSTYGGADAYHFYVPDMRGVVPVGYKSGDSNFGEIGWAAGEARHLLSGAESGVVDHRHILRLKTTGGSTGYDDAAVRANSGAEDAAFRTGGAAAFSSANGSNGYGSTTGAMAAAENHNNLQPYRVRQFVIKT